MSQTTRGERPVPARSSVPDRPARSRLLPHAAAAAALAALMTAVLLLAAGVPAAGAVTRAAPAADPGRAPKPAAALREARALLNARPERAGKARRARAASASSRAGRRHFPREQNVFLKSAIRLRDLETPGRANVTLPAFTGVGPDGRANVSYIVTEAADFDVARILGVNYAPKLAFGRGTDASQDVTLDRGRLRFRGAVDFSPVRVLRAGTGPSAFPPAEAQPGAVADEEWSSLVVLPSGSVLNVAVVANATGEHDRLIRMTRDRSEATLELLDGWQGGDRFYYHLVTDSSDPVAATVEQGVYSPRLGRLAAYGQSNVFDQSALLGFSPNANGETGASNPQRQGLNSTIVDGDLDPVNVFPLDPDNDRRYLNNYSPMWDAHVSEWTEEAIASGQRRAITGFGDLRDLVERGLVRSFAGSMGESNGFVAGLRSTEIIINCPVIAQPFERNGSDDDATPFRP